MRSVRGPVAWFVRNGVAANLLVLVILVGGALSLLTLKKEVFPEFSADQISVAMIYRGAAPEEVEESICVRIEEAVEGLDGVKRIRSVATEGVGAVTIELLPGADASKALDEVKARVDAIDTFPEEVEQPVIQEVIIRSQVINVAISGETDEATSKENADSPSSVERHRRRCIAQDRKRSRKRWESGCANSCATSEQGGQVNYSMGHAAFSMWGRIGQKDFG